MTGYVVSNKNIKSNYYRIRVHAPFIAQKAAPGQFGMIQINNLYDPLLRRPMSFHRVYRKEGIVEFLFQVTGRGTDLISRFKTGHEVKISGPMGSGFKIKKRERILIVAGGIGISPLFSLMDELMGKAGEGPERIFLYMGGRTRDDILCAADLKRMGIAPEITTDDGSLGKKGLVTVPLQKILTRLTDTKSAIIYTCGPHGMLHAVHKLATDYSVECQVSMESMMACGTGACLGCVVETISDTGDGYGYKTVCKDGPVFNSEKIIW